MAQGTPNGWPGYQLPLGPGIDPNAPLDAAGSVPPSGPPLGPGDVDNSAQWSAINVLAGGIVAAFGVLGIFAYFNSRDHRELEQKIEGVDQRLFDYQQAHALVHDVLRAQIEGLQNRSVPAPVYTPSFAPPQTVTIYGEPLLVMPAPVSSGPMTPMIASYASGAHTSLPPSTRPATVFSMPVPSVESVTVALPSPSSGTRATLPPQLEAALASALSRPALDALFARVHAHPHPSRSLTQMSMTLPADLIRQATVAMQQAAPALTPVVQQAVQQALPAIQQTMAQPEVQQAIAQTTQQIAQQPAVQQAAHDVGVQVGAGATQGALSNGTIAAIGVGAVLLLGVLGFAAYKAGEQG